MIQVGFVGGAQDGTIANMDEPLADFLKIEGEWYELDDVLGGPQDGAPIYVISDNDLDRVP